MDKDSSGKISFKELLQLAQGLPEDCEHLLVEFDKWLAPRFSIFCDEIISNHDPKRLFSMRQGAESMDFQTFSA